MPAVDAVVVLGTIGALMSSAVVVDTLESRSKSKNLLRHAPGVVLIRPELVLILPELRQVAVLPVEEEEVVCCIVCLVAYLKRGANMSHVLLALLEELLVDKLVVEAEQERLELLLKHAEPVVVELLESEPLLWTL